MIFLCSNFSAFDSSSLDLWKIWVASAAVFKISLCFWQARREKISERMKILQDLVPGCNKVGIRDR